MSDAGNDARGEPGESERREMSNLASSSRRGEDGRRSGDPASSPCEL